MIKCTVTGKPSAFKRGISSSKGAPALPDNFTLTTFVKNVGAEKYQPIQFIVYVPEPLSKFVSSLVEKGYTIMIEASDFEISTDATASTHGYMMLEKVYTL